MRADRNEGQVFERKWFINITKITSNSVLMLLESGKNLAFENRVEQMLISACQKSNHTTVEIFGFFINLFLFNLQKSKPKL
ncbi:hypothetical protein ABE29_02285 [Cytobacillus firmus]|nr:hypothetical protein [Cytobacillus firmus]MBG9549711.1 hypothetical protein [Cytobacillus firmus]MBG9553498.1 hypothetical protein [Cytobacillus firmus]MBG9556719.1 hypothetical protein [Cytobacillus firmus]MBG9574794.1 hypothetical protein [Cytobacillus firmus]